MLTSVASSRGMKTFYTKTSAMLRYRCRGLASSATLGMKAPDRFNVGRRLIYMLLKVITTVVKADSEVKCRCLP